VIFKKFAKLFYGNEKTQIPVVVSIIGLGGAHLIPTREEAVNSAWLTGCVLLWTDLDLYRLGLSLMMTDRQDGDQGLEARPDMSATGGAGQDLTAGLVAPIKEFFLIIMRGAEAGTVITGEDTAETEREIFQEEGGTLIERETGEFRRSAVHEEDRERLRILTGAVLVRREAYHPRSWKLSSWSHQMMKLSYCPDTGLRRKL
jgi:hypothetical protein